MKTVPMLLMRLLPTTVTLGFLWLVTKQGPVLEMATALLVLLIDYLQLVNVSVYFCFENLKTPLNLLPAITCPTLLFPNNGSIDFGGASSDENSTYAFNVVATYNCDTGFSLVGNHTRTCTGDGNSTTGAFNKLSPTCERECTLCFENLKLLPYPSSHNVPRSALPE